MGILQNFVDKVGPVVSAAWLNGVDLLTNKIFNSATTNAQARANLTSDAPYEIANGGTGARDSTDALVNLGVEQYINSTINQQFLGNILIGVAAAETAVGAVIVNSAFLPGYVERYGADPTGASDSGPAFRTACAVMAAAGGGKIYALGALYNFITWDTVGYNTANALALFNLPSNTELVGGGQFYTKLRISQTARTGMYAGGINTTTIIGMRFGQINQYIHDLQFDYNGIPQAAANDMCYLVVGNHSGGWKIERTYCKQAPLTNAFADGGLQAVATGTPCIIRNNWLQDCGPNMTGNSVNQDLSYIYLQSPNSTVEGNIIFNTNKAAHNCGGIECHSIGYKVRNNFIKNCWPAMYLGVQDGVTVSTGSIIDSNYFGFNVSGLELIDQHEGLKITKNYFEANTPESGVGNGPGFTDIFSPLNGITGAVSSGVQTGLSITDNTFDCTLHRDGSLNLASISVNLGCLQGFRLAHNTWINGFGLFQLAGNSTAPNIGCEIEYNLSLSTQDAGALSGMFQLLCSSSASWPSNQPNTDIFFRKNKILRSRSLSATVAQAFVVTNAGPALSTFTNVRWEDNEQVNIAPGVLNIGATVIVNGQSSTSQNITANSQTITTNGFSSVRVLPNAAYTGIILQPWASGSPMVVTVINESPAVNSMTMAAPIISNVADGASCIIAGVQQKTFYWDLSTNLWYHS